MFVFLDELWTVLWTLLENDFLLDGLCQLQCPLFCMKLIRQSLCLIKPIYACPSVVILILHSVPCVIFVWWRATRDVYGVFVLEVDTVSSILRPMWYYCLFGKCYHSLIGIHVSDRWWKKERREKKREGKRDTSLRDTRREKGRCFRCIERYTCSRIKVERVRIRERERQGARQRE